MDIQLRWEIKKIINVANELQTYGSTGGSTGEQIAAAFVLNQMDLLPANYRDVLEAWGRLEGPWQKYVKHIKRHQMHLIREPG